MSNSYHATVKALMEPVLPDGFSGFHKAHLGQCSACTHRLVTELPFGNGDRGEVHLCVAKHTELGIEDEHCATKRRCQLFSLQVRVVTTAPLSQSAAPAGASPAAAA